MGFEIVKLLAVARIVRIRSAVAKNRIPEPRLGEGFHFGVSMIEFAPQ
jgi:hypothetical protein